MYCKDFEFDGHRLSDYGCIVCHILGNADASAISIGSNITFTTVKASSSNEHDLLSTQYDEVYTTTFEICKHNCNDENDKYFTQEEISYLMRWLNRKTFKKFKMVYDDGTLANVYYNASFNVKPITFGGNIIGLELSMQTNAPFGYYDEIEYIMEFTSNNLSHDYYDISDEIGYIYPSTFKIELLSSGNFELVNSQESDRIIKIKNCTNGEIITFTKNKSIVSSNVHSKLFNDFNYKYPRICNEHEDIYNDGYAVDNMKNTFTVNMPCKITFIYSPICKMGIV